jgi:hypothetical protein
VKPVLEFGGLKHLLQFCFELMLKATQYYRIPGTGTLTPRPLQSYSPICCATSSR